MPDPGPETGPEAEQGAPARRWLWFWGLWLASIAVVGSVALIIRTWLGLQG